MTKEQERGANRGRDQALLSGEPFGARLRRLREAAGLTQEELAVKAGLTAKGVGAIERGERKRPTRIPYARSRRLWI